MKYGKQYHLFMILLFIYFTNIKRENLIYINKSYQKLISIKCSLGISNVICELCRNEAHFKNSKGEPYLEIQHIVWLSKGVDDTIENTAALCPNVI